MSESAGEFEKIRRFFAPLARGNAAALEMRDDAALLDIPTGCQLVVSADMLAEGIHFRGEDSLSDVARKALRANLSDMAAKGAAPLGYFLSLCWPRHLPEARMQEFAEGLAKDGEAFDISLLGGDLIAAETLTIAVTIMGSVAKGSMLLRKSAQPGDDFYVSGTLGDSALGLELLHKAFAAKVGTGFASANATLKTRLPQEQQDYLRRRYLLPEPRLALGRALADIGCINASIDISDGLLADLGHICEASGVGARIQEASLPLSPAARALLEEDDSLRQYILGGGDDYELLFSAKPERRDAMKALGHEHCVTVTRIGVATRSEGILLVDSDGKERAATGAGGYRHF